MRTSTYRFENHYSNSFDYIDLKNIDKISLDSDAISHNKNDETVSIKVEYQLKDSDLHDLIVIVAKAEYDGKTVFSQQEINIHDFAMQTARAIHYKTTFDDLSSFSKEKSLMIEDIKSKLNL